MFAFLMITSGVNLYHSEETEYSNRRPVGGFWWQIAMYYCSGHLIECNTFKMSNHYEVKQHFSEQIHERPSRSMICELDDQYTVVRYRTFRL